MSMEIHLQLNLEAALENIGSVERENSPELRE